MRLGFAVKPLSKPDLKSHDGRRWQNNPHLSVSLVCLQDIIRHLSTHHIGMYRASSDLAPYVAHPDLPQFHTQLTQCTDELALVGQMAREAGLRLSFHPAQHVVLNSPDANLLARSKAELTAQAMILELMGLGPEAVVVTHLGGVYGNRETARQRFVQEYQTLPEVARKRLVLENDDTRFAVQDTVWVHRQTGIRLVFDNLHHRLYNPNGWQTREALAASLATWPPGVRPKVHFSSPRTEWLVTERPCTDLPEVRHARWSYHADYVNPFEFIDFLRMAHGLQDFDIMLEVRAKDLALMQLRNDLARYAPELLPQAELAAQSSPASRGAGRTQSNGNPRGDFGEAWTRP
jgi:UV DNA damage endonuclease